MMEPTSREEAPQKAPSEPSEELTAAPGPSVRDPHPAAPLAPVSESPRTGWLERWETWSSRAVEQSKTLSGGVQQASGEAIGHARERMSTWSLRRERVRCVRLIGESVLTSKQELSEHLPAGALIEIARIEAIDEELMRLGLMGQREDDADSSRNASS